MSSLDTQFAERLAAALLQRNIIFEEKKMFGGLAFMVNTHMTVGITNKNAFMVRCQRAKQEELLARGAQPMLFTGKPMAGFLFVDMEQVDKDIELEFWIDIGLEFALNQPAKKPKTEKTKSR